MEPPEGAFDTLRRLVAVLERAGIPYMVVGGLASFAWGDPRTTRDFDIAVVVDEEPGVVGGKVRGVLASAGVEPLGPYSTAFGMRYVLPFPALPFDVFLVGREDAIEFVRRRQQNIAGMALWFVSPEDFVASKLRNAKLDAAGQREDLQDAAAVLFRQWPTFLFEEARNRAKATGVEVELETLVDDVRAERLR
ncbi:MAG: hypothetical protein LC624_11390, partial [Halobacteriales archaeon]|nr:hypothetical protein [Halobacteriales archaeon]